jgi:hypothetical protein
METRTLSVPKSTPATIAMIAYSSLPENVSLEPKTIPALPSAFPPAAC